MSSQEFVKIAISQYTIHGNAQKATAMSAYMRNLFPYLGINRPQRDVINKELFSLIKGVVNEGFIIESVSLLWQKEEREYQYLALDLMVKYVSKLTPSVLPIILDLAQQKAWWDSIDLLATKIIGKLVEKYPVLKETMDELSVHDNNWLKRIAILHQISYKHHTETTRLFRYCLINAHHTDFFIRKAIGWALREYSKTNALAVREFVQQNQDILSNLSKKEALKRIG
ncbi:MAG: DNA alkylation repair protein [Thermoflexibacter sp.]|jgi:3-methyladenine DNA glycosylase AlkD|nr:DNA alkylation repair protein [Thermoflexibacter sp.]